MSNARELRTFLTTVAKHQNKDSVMLWGAPGIGKSSVVAQVATENNLLFTDVRISQMMPGDLRGLPAADIANDCFRYLAPNFLPKEDSAPGILFLDEITQAPPTVQAIAQQLILDRKVGDYVVPDNWFIWAAGNRQQDKTGVYAMPTALANRFNHIEVTHDFDTWKLDYALANIAPEVVAFLSFRPNLLHKMDVGTTAWPSPRSWSQASRLHQMGLAIDPAVGMATQAEFSTFLVLYKELPNLDLIVQGKGNSITWPTEVSLQYAVTEGLLGRSLAATGPQLMNIVHWMSEHAGVEYSNKFFSEIMDLGFDRVPNLAKLMAATSSDPKVLAVVQKMNALQSYSY